MISPFFEIPRDRHLAENELAFAVPDLFPVSKGHSLIVVKRLVPDWWSATRAEQAAMLDLVEVVKDLLDERYGPDGYNVGFNAGVAAGQTILHAHLHIIPRFTGDVADPTGGVRATIPGKGNYLVASPKRTRIK
jgi:diadenosine tetraphosphate (Ap4A) HIT family hydrolase